MRLPIILALAVIVLTPANIRDVLVDAAGEARALVGSVLGQAAQGETVDVAELDAAKSRHETTKNAVADIR